MAMLLHASADDVGQERFSDEACFGMATGRRSERTTVAANEVFAFALVKASRATHVLENGKGGLDPAFPVFPFKLRQMVAREGSSHFTQSGPEFSGRQLPGKDGQDNIEERTVCLRENLLGFVCERVGCVRFSESSLRPRLADQSIPFKA